MDLYTYTNWKNDKLFNQEQLEKFMLVNNNSYVYRLIYEDNKYSNNSTYIKKITIHRFFDIMDKIIFVIKNNENESINIFDLSVIMIEIDSYTKFNLTIEKDNIVYNDQNILIINFNLKNIVKCQNKNIGGIPLFLFDENEIKLIINFKKKINFDFDKILNVYIGGFIVLGSYLINTRVMTNNKISKLILTCDEKKKIMNKLEFYPDSVILKNDNNIILQHLNLVSYNKIICKNCIKYNLELEQETSYLIFNMCLDTIHKIKNFIIRLNDNYIFDSDIYTLYSDGYFIFRFNSRLLENSKITLLLLINETDTNQTNTNQTDTNQTNTNQTDTNQILQEFDTLLQLQIYNVYDLIIE
jgi:hypothetical protein